MGMAVIVLLLFVVLIFLYFTYSYWQLSNETGKIKADIDIAKRLIDYQDNDTENFYRDYEEINTNLKNTPSVSHAWQEFTEHITFDKNTAGDHVVKNSIQPSSYFSVDNLLAKNTKIKRSHYVTWNLLGLGTVGAAIVFILAMASMGAVPDHALVLMKIAKYVNYALVCFAMGLGFALFFSTLQKREIIHIEDKLHEFNTNLENALVFSTANQVLDEVLNVLMEQNKKIDGISNNIALGNSNSTEIELAREKQNDELLHKLTHNFSDKLQQLFTEQSPQIAETLAELKQHSSTTADKFYHKLQQLVEQEQNIAVMFSELQTEASRYSQSLSDKLQQLSTEQGQQIAKTLAELKQHSSTNADRFYHKLQQLFTHQEQHTTVALEKLKESNISNTDRLYDRLGDLSVSQEQFDYEVQATIKKQPREDHEYEDKNDCSNEEEGDKESVVENNFIPLERIS